VDDYGVDEAFEPAMAAAEQGWDYPPLVQVLQGEITERGAWEKEAPSYADALTIARLNVLERQARSGRSQGLGRALCDHAGPPGARAGGGGLWTADHRRPEAPYSQERARQVYRFKAALQYRPGLWRRLEIQGGQSLAPFDAILRHAFHHDTADHLGGFWKLVRRGTGRLFREVDLGDIDPLGGGSGAGQHLAGLGLKPGDELKYVYDFGDWIEH
jgi:hypothetical protein